MDLEVDAGNGEGVGVEEVLELAFRAGRGRRFGVRRRARNDRAREDDIVGCSNKMVEVDYGWQRYRWKVVWEEWNFRSFIWCRRDQILVQPTVLCSAGPWSVITSQIC